MGRGAGSDGHPSAPGTEAVHPEATGSAGQRAWEALVDRFGPMLWAIATSYGLTGREVAEVYRTTWLRLADRFDPMNGPEGVAEWLGTVARRESVRTLRLSGRDVPPGAGLVVFDF